MGGAGSGGRTAGAGVADSLGLPEEAAGAAGTGGAEGGSSHAATCGDDGGNSTGRPRAAQKS